MSCAAICRWSGKNREKKSERSNPARENANRISLIRGSVLPSSKALPLFWCGRLITELIRLFTFCEDIFVFCLIAVKYKIELPKQQKHWNLLFSLTDRTKGIVALICRCWRMHDRAFVCYTCHIFANLVNRKKCCYFVCNL